MLDNGFMTFWQHTAETWLKCFSLWHQNYNEPLKERNKPASDDTG
jgi:hypothetical protein